LLLFGGGLCLAGAFKVEGGLNEYLKAAFAGLGGLPPWLVIVAVAFGLTALSEVASNTAAISMMLPILQSLAEGIGTPPLPILMAGTLAASCGFALPIATMPNTIAYGTGEVSVGQMGRAGLVLDVVATLGMIAAVLWLVPLVF
jgi:sodium-dependent dicarboxylate transporter 2/3/5